MARGQIWQTFPKLLRFMALSPLIFEFLFAGPGDFSRLFWLLARPGNSRPEVHPSFRETSSWAYLFWPSAQEHSWALVRGGGQLYIRKCLKILQPSGSRFDPHPQRLPIFHLNLGGRSESLPREPGFPEWGSESQGNCSGSSFCPDQVLLSDPQTVLLGSGQDLSNGPFLEIRAKPDN